MKCWLPNSEVLTSRLGLKYSPEEVIYLYTGSSQVRVGFVPSDVSHTAKGLLVKACKCVPGVAKHTHVIGVGLLGLAVLWAAVTVHTPSGSLLPAGPQKIGGRRPSEQCWGRNVHLVISMVLNEWFQPRSPLNLWKKYTTANMFSSTYLPICVFQKIHHMKALIIIWWVENDILSTGFGNIWYTANIWSVIHTNDPLSF